MRHPIRQAIHHDHRIVGKPPGTVGIEPAAPQEEVIGEVPVKQGHPWLNVVREQFIDQAIVEGQTGFVYGPDVSGQNARPRDRQPVGLEADLRQQPHVFLVAMIVIAGDIAGLVLPYPALLTGHHVPDGKPLAILIPRAFDLVRGGRHPPHVKSLRKLTIYFSLVWMMDSHENAFHPAAVPDALGRNASPIFRPWHGEPRRPPVPDQR